MKNEIEIFPDVDTLENLGRATDPLIEQIARLTLEGRIIWKKEIDVDDQYYYAIVGEAPNTYKLEFQGVHFNIDQHALILWRKQLKPRQADQLRFVIRNNWKDHVAKKREEFQELVTGLLNESKNKT
jgi:hypothetical protein